MFTCSPVSISTISSYPLSFLYAAPLISASVGQVYSAANAPGLFSIASSSLASSPEVLAI